MESMEWILGMMQKLSLEMYPFYASREIKTLLDSVELKVLRLKTHACQ